MNSSREDIDPRKRADYPGGLEGSAAEDSTLEPTPQLVEQLRQKCARLENENRMKDEFLSVLSHELRTPLTPILSWVTILRECGEQDRELFEEGLQTIERCVAGQMNIIEELLDLTRILNNKVRLESEVVDPLDALALAGRFAEVTIHDRSIRLDVVAIKDPEPLWADPKRLHQILGNLVTNAVKFTPDGGTITLALRQVEGAVEFLVSDSGIGISPALLPHVFERFRQGDASTTRHHGGLGIGLSVVRGLTELQGGSVRAESHGEGRGSTFVIRMPVATAEQRQAAPANVKPDGVVVASRSPEQRVERILIVDDSHDTLTSLRHLIERAGYHVETAHSVDSGLKLVVESRPKLIISDLGMPDADGFELLRRLQERPELQSIPVIALTGFVSANDRDAVLTAGFLAHIAKPVDPHLLLEAIDGALNTDGNAGA